MSDVSQHNRRQLVLLLLVVGVRGRAWPLGRARRRQSAVVLVRHDFHVGRRRRPLTTLRRPRRTLARREMSVRDFDVPDVVVAEKNWFV